MSNLKEEIKKNKHLYFLWCKINYFIKKKDFKVFFYQTEKDINHNKLIYNKYDLSFDPTLDNSFKETIEIKYKIFNAISKKKSKESLKILEIGTLDGLFAKYLSSIFANSEIFTIDLPHTDKRFFTSYNREDVLKKFLEKRKENISKDKIKFFEMDSINLLEKFDKNFFDLVFVDGDHKDPVVTMDIFNSYKVLKKEGLLIIDDLYLTSRTGKNNELIGHAPSADGLNALKKLSNETGSQFDLLVKFYGPKNHFYNPMVGILQK